MILSSVLLAFIAQSINSVQASQVSTSSLVNATHFTNAFHSTNIVADWITCNPSADTCVSAGAVCCIATADLSSGKYTCRPSASGLYCFLARKYTFFN